MPHSRHQKHDTTPPAGPTAPWRLREELIALSVADSWVSARAEWALDHVYLADEPSRCLCGHPIIECCVLVNRLTGIEAVVGNVCVTKFLDIPSEPIFACLRRIARNIAAALNEAAIVHASERGWITAWERTFYLDTMRLYKLSPRQRAWRVAINERLLALVGKEAQHAGR